MADSIMLDKAKDFAVTIVNLCKFIKETKRESVLTNQLLRSGTSIGANIHESKYAHGTADFIAKMQIALKECYESEYWLELLRLHPGRTVQASPKRLRFAPSYADRLHQHHKSKSITNQCRDDPHPGTFYFTNTK